MAQEIQIKFSDTNKENPYALTIDMVTGIEIVHKNNLFRKGDGNCVKIYCDNGGSFYNYKINDEFMNCKPLLDKLHKYQITNDLTDKIFNMNCITYALQQSGKFDQKTIDNIKVNSYARYVSHKDLDKLGTQFNIAFKIVKPRDDKNQVDNITPGKKIIGSPNADAVLI